MEYNRETTQLIVICNQKRKIEMDIKELHPIILIGEGLDEKYNGLPVGEKKKAAILSGIEVSNMPSSLCRKRNISKNTLRKLATGLDVYPVIFFLPSQFIRTGCLIYREDEGIAKADSIDCILNLSRMELLQEANASHPSFNNQEVLSSLWCLSEKLFQNDPANPRGKQFVQTMYLAIIQVVNTMTDNL